MTRPKVLLLERTAAIHDAMRESLESENCEVVSSRTFAESLDQIYERQDFDVLITNLRTQRAEDHPQLIAAMRTFRPECLLVAVTDFLDVRDAQRAILLQADYIVKASNVKDVAKLLKARIAEADSLQARTPDSLSSKLVGRSQKGSAA
jgi:DNA-binding NtrC family response regulator